MAFHSLYDADNIVAILVGCLTVAVAVLLRTILRKHISSSLPFPPGPKGLAIVGNAGDIPSSHPWIAYSKWAKKYGDLVHLQVYGQHIVIVNSVKVAHELLGKRSNIYSDRPLIPMIKLMGWDFNVGFMPYSDSWRRHRRLMHQAFRPKASLNYRPIQLRKVHEFLQGLLSSPEDFVLHYKTLGTSMIMAVLYGYEVKPKDDHFVIIAEGAVAKLSESVFQGAAIVNTFPVLRHLPAWFPGAGFKRFALEAKELTTEMQNDPLRYVRRQMEAGVDPRSVVAEMLSRNDAQGGSIEEEDTIKHVAATAYAAGADTTASSIATFLLAMCMYPDVQRKAQLEIDTIIGLQRLPDYDDRPNLPYVEAVYREVMRWHPVLPLGVAHATIDNDIYNDYLIPKGATVIANIWAMTHDDKIYSDPDAFIPERFLKSDGQINDDDTILAFGFGRRICVGRYLADTTVWATVVSVLATFSLAKAMDDAGKEIKIEENYTGSLFSHPLPFRCSITPRSADSERLVLSTVVARGMNV